MCFDHMILPDQCYKRQLMTPIRYKIIIYNCFINRSRHAGQKEHFGHIIDLTLVVISYETVYEKSIQLKACFFKSMWNGRRCQNMFTIWPL